MKLPMVTTASKVFVSRQLDSMRRWVLMLVPVVLVVTMLVPSRTAVAEPAGCAGPNGYGPWVHTNAGFSQRVGLNVCENRATLGVRVGFKPDRGFTGSHVVACTIHFGVYDEDAKVSLGEQTRDCTAAARLSNSWEMNSLGVFSPIWSVRRYHITGYINIRTATYYNTYPYASRYRFCWNARECAG